MLLNIGVYETYHWLPDANHVTGTTLVLISGKKWTAPAFSQSLLSIVLLLKAVL